MIYPYGNLNFPVPFHDPKVDDIINTDGVIDEFGLLDLAVTDDELIENLDERINDSRTFYDDPNGFNLSQRRSDNLRMYTGVQADPRDYYDQEDPYIENRIRPAVDSIVAYATARSPQSVVTPADGTPEAKKFASNLEKAHNMHSVEFDLRGILEIGVRSWLLYQEAYLMLEFDPDYGEDGEVVPRFVPSDEIVVDKNWRYGERPAFMTLFEKKTIQDLLHMFPEKRKEILESIHAKREGPKNVQQEMVIKRTWFDYYDPETDKPAIGVAIHYDKVMLAKYRNPNWLHNRKNFLKRDMMPILNLSVINDGKHAVDFSTPIDDGIRLQRLINARGKQIGVNASRSNGTTVINGKLSGLTKEDAENWTQGPNEKIYLKKAKDGANKDEMIWQLPGQDVKEFIINAQSDLRNQLAYIIGVPLNQDGADQISDDTTLGQQLLKKSDSNARQDMIVRAIDRLLYNYFNLLTQLMFRWYEKDHVWPFQDTDGTFENIVIKRYYFDDGMKVNVKGLSTIAFDKNREQAMATHLVDHNGISHYDYYRIAGFENPQKLYDNWVKEQKDPWQLVRDNNIDYDEGDAYAEFLDILNGSEPKMKREANREYILTMRKLMLTQRFIEAKTKYQQAYMKRFERYMDLFELRTSLDQLGDGDLSQIMPGRPIPPPQPTPAPQPGMPPQQPQGPPQGPPQAPGAQSPAPGGSIFGGTGLMNPAAAQPQTGLSAIPAI